MTGVQTCALPIYLEREFFTPLARGATTLPGRKIRIWSAACSTGQEPYSLAINAIESLPDLSGWDCKILGTDLSNYAVAEARAARYASDKMDGVSTDQLRKHFVKHAVGGETVFDAGPHLRALVSIARLNLMEPWPFKGRFDIIFCRNVMIYFDAETRTNLVRRFHDLLNPNGILAVGSAETLARLDVPFRPVQASIYVKQ